MHAYGDADKLKIDLTSDPALAQDDIFLLLTVGLTRAELDQTERKAGLGRHPQESRNQGSRATHLIGLRRSGQRVHDLGRPAVEQVAEVPPRRRRIAVTTDRRVVGRELRRGPGEQRCGRVGLVLAGDVGGGAAGWIEHGPEAGMDRLRQALDQLAVTR